MDPILLDTVAPFWLYCDEISCSSLLGSQERSRGVTQRETCVLYDLEKCLCLFVNMDVVSLADKFHCSSLDLEVLQVVWKIGL